MEGDEDDAQEEIAAANMKDGGNDHDDYERDAAATPLSHDGLLGFDADGTLEQTSSQPPARAGCDSAGGNGAPSRSGATAVARLLLIGSPPAIGSHS